MDIMDLVFRARTQELDQAEKKLDKIADSAEKAERKAKGLDNTLGGFSKLGGPIGQVAGNVSDLSDKAESATASFGRVGGAVTLVGVAAAAAVTGAVKLTLAVADMADAMNDLSNRTNLSTERLSLMDAMAKMAGSSVEELVSSSERLGAKLAKQDEESGKAVTALKDIGISTKDTNGELKSMIALQEEIVLAVDSATDKAKAEGAAIQLLGNDYYKLRTAIKETAEQKAEMYDYMQKVGAVVTTDLAKRSDQLNDNISKLGLSFKGMGNSIATITVPILNAVIEKLTGISEKAADIMRRWAGGSTSSEVASGNVGRIQDQLAYKRGQLGGLAARNPANRTRIESEIAALEAELTAAQSDARQARGMDARAKDAAINGRLGEGNRPAGRDAKAKNGKEAKDPHLTPEQIAKKQMEADEQWNKELGQLYAENNKLIRQQYEEQTKASAELDKQAERVKHLINPYRELAEELRQLQVLRDTGRLSDEEYTVAAEKNAERFSEAQKKMTKASEETSKVGQLAINSLSNAITDMVMGADVSFKSLARSFIKAVFDMLVMEPLLKYLKSLVSSIGGDSGGGFWGGVVNAFGGMFGGGRANGGPVSSGRMYEVNERGSPELLNVGSKQYLMMGGQSGYVTPTGAGRGSGVGIGQVVVQVNVEGSGKDAKRDGELAGNAAAVAFMKAIAQGEIANALRYGGQLNR